MSEDFASCNLPIWRVDDFTNCFQSDYLGILFPLIVISLSLAHLIFQSIQRAFKTKRASHYKQISHVADHTELPSEEQDSLSGDDDGEDLTIGGAGGGRLALVKTTTKGSIVQADTPPGQQLSVIVEELAIVGLVAINAIAFLTGTYAGRGRGQLVAVVGVVTWVYVLVLATLRLFLGTTKWRVPRLWNHTATIYGLQWLFTVVVFRSVLINPSSRLAQVLVITEFSLTTLLFTMAMTTRKGNKTVVLEWEGSIEPSREPLASVFSLLTFSWVDSILWQGFKEPFEIEMVWNLLPKDKAAAVLAEYRQFKKTTSLAWHLGKYFKTMLLLQALWALVEGVLTFAPTLLLKAILEYVEKPDATPRNVLWLYVVLLPLSDLVRSVANGQALWIGRKICIQIRAIVIGEIYAKALRRKASSGKDTVLLADANKDAAKESRLDRLRRFVGLKKKDVKKVNDQPAENAEGGDPAKPDLGDVSDEQANIGTIINLMSVDSFKIGDCTAYLHFLIASAPAELVVAVALLYQVMGLSAIPGLVVMVILLPVNIILAKGFNYTQKKIMAATDKRIHTTNEVLQNIRIIKYFAWEHRFSQIVDEKRSVELKALRNRFMVWALAVAIWNTVPVLITFFSFLVYTKIEGKPLYPSVAFTAISLFMLLRVPLDQLGDMIAHVQEAKVSVDRVEEFLKEDETEKYIQLGLDNVDEAGNKVIGFRNATFIWGSKDAVAADGTMAFRLLDLTSDFKVGKLNVIAGQTGSGKTSMLMALLGEMSIMEGKVYLPGGRSREDVRVDPETGLAETCAYVAQSAWLVNANVKENILFSAPYDERRYKDVIVACALERDLEILDNGDETLVGEKGITLSGGQKQRISLARAVYSNSRHLLLDDCLSAVDAHTAQWIFNNCIRGPLMKDRTCILVTHNVSLCVPSSEYVVVLDNGRVTAQGSPSEVIATGALGEDLQTKSRPGSSHVSRIPSRVPSSVGEESGETLVDDGGNGDLNGKRVAKKEKKKRDAMEETKATGAVKWPVLKLYLTAMGSWWFWVITILVFSGQQLSVVASNFWIKEWATQYTSHIDQTISAIRFSPSSHTTLGSSASFPSVQSFYRFVRPAEYSADNAPAEVDANYYLIGLGLIGVAGAVLALIRDLWLFFGSLTASWKLHNRLMDSVTKATFKFFDSTPLGQLMNRFSKDLEAIDQEVAPVAIGVMSCALAIVVTVVLICFITPGFLIAGVFITILYVLVGMFYLRASRDLKRLESVHRSPLFQQFGETLNGVTTIRAYGDERRFIRDNLAKINTQARPFIYLWAANRWLSFRTDLLGDLVAFFAGVFVILSIGKIDAGSVGISLSYAVGFADNVLWLVRLYAMNEQNMNSVERVKEYLDVEQEAEPINEKNRPPENWPASGSVEFIGYSTRYRADLDPVLREVTFKINPLEKVGIVGRTGAGKSSLALALFRALEAENGKILIDDIDIGAIGLRDLREAITIVPQDPTLFTGTIRTNLDPFNLYTDEEIFNALRRVQLIGPDETPATPVTPTATRLILPPVPTIETPAGEERQSGSSTPAAGNKNVFLDLSSPVSESGSNLSQGQRQLLCLARAMLKNPKVLIMDEATASIDYATDGKIQETIRELKGTIITIAHRLATIVDYDKVLLLDHGAVVEYGHPWELLQKADGSFRSMCETSGDLDSLTKAAKKAFESKRLIDDE